MAIKRKKIIGQRCRKKLNSNLKLWIAYKLSHNLILSITLRVWYFPLFTWIIWLSIEIILECKIYKNRDLDILLSCSLWYSNILNSGRQTIGAQQIFVEWFKRYVYIWARRTHTHTHTLWKEMICFVDCFELFICLLYLNCYYNITCDQNKIFSSCA